MFKPFPRLDAGCQLEICRAWMLDYDHEVKVFELGSDPQGCSILRSRRRAADNALTLVNKSTHELFESIVDTHVIYALELDGFHVDVEGAKWANVMPLSTIRSLRLKIDFSRLESWIGPSDAATLPGVMTVRARIDASLADVTKLLTKFINLRDLQLITVIDLHILPLRASGNGGPRDTSKRTYWELRSYLLHNYANPLGCASSKLTAVHVSFVMLQRQVEIGRLFDMPISTFDVPHSTKRRLVDMPISTFGVPYSTKRRLVDISNSTKKRTSLGWRHNLKYFEMSCTREDTRRLVAAAKEIGLKTERDGSGYLMFP